MASIRPHFIPTRKLTEILDSHHCVGVNGADYEPIKHEMLDALWSRQSRTKVSDPWEEYEDYLDSVGVPPLPLEA